MPAHPLHPLKFEPILRRLIWGGRRLGSVLHKPIGDADDYAESWEISDYKDEVSVVSEGLLLGSSLRDLIRERGRELLGESFGGLSQFPLLVKYIDARQVLSVQVHPDDEKGRRLANDNGKTEAWIVVASDPGGAIYAGLKPGVTRGDFASAIRLGEVEPLLHRFQAVPGDCVFIPAGTVHAIGAGVVLAEIQQMSDATFRVFDWNRVGPDGLPRKLHISEALESTDFERGPVAPSQSPSRAFEGGTIEDLARCEFFEITRLKLNSTTTIGAPDRFTIVLNLGGVVDLRSGDFESRLSFGETMLLPACVGACRVTPRDSATLLTCRVPEPLG